MTARFLIFAMIRSAWADMTQAVLACSWLITLVLRMLIECGNQTIRALRWPVYPMEVGFIFLGCPGFRSNRYFTSGIGTAVIATWNAR
jgi:hypothetical protein